MLLWPSSFRTRAILFTSHFPTRRSPRYRRVVEAWGGHIRKTFLDLQSCCLRSRLGTSGNERTQAKTQIGATAHPCLLSNNDGRLRSKIVAKIRTGCFSQHGSFVLQTCCLLGVHGFPCLPRKTCHWLIDPGILWAALFREFLLATKRNRGERMPRPKPHKPEFSAFGHVPKKLKSLRSAGYLVLDGSIPEVSFCGDGSLRGFTGDEQEPEGSQRGATGAGRGARQLSPCRRPSPSLAPNAGTRRGAWMHRDMADDRGQSSRWFGLPSLRSGRQVLVSSALKRSRRAGNPTVLRISSLHFCRLDRFKIQLGAEGRAHPLVTTQALHSGGTREAETNH